MSRNFISVYFLDSSFKTLAMDESMTCEELAAQVSDEIELRQDVDDFRFFIFNNNQELMIDPSENPLKHLTGADIRNGINPAANKLVFKRAFFRGADEEITCEELKHLMFHQSKGYFLTSLWPTTFDIAVTLAGLLISDKYGDNPEVDKVGFLAQHYREFFPAVHSGKMKPKVLEQKLIASHRNNAGLTPKEAQQRFYDIIRENCPVFGSVPYLATCSRLGDKKGKGKVAIAVTCDGLYVLEFSEMSVVLHFPLSRIKNWTSQGSALSVEVLENEGDSTPATFVFESQYASQLSLMLRVYVDRTKAEADGNFPLGDKADGRPAASGTAAGADADDDEGDDPDDAEEEGDEEEEEEAYDYGDEEDV